MIWYKLRKDKLVSEENVHYIGYGINVYSWFWKIKIIKDVSLDKKQLKLQIKMWNQCRIKLEHLEAVVEDFVESDSLVKKETVLS